MKFYFLYFLKYTKIPTAIILSITAEATTMVVGISGSGVGEGVGEDDTSDPTGTYFRVFRPENAYKNS